MIRNTSAATITLVRLLPVLLLLASCQRKSPLFRQVKAADSGIQFNNEIIQNDSINVLDFSNVYNGGGVGFGDFNNDGLQDVYLTGNLVSNKLYLNKGDLRFEDITEVAGVGGNGKFCRGIAVIDINNDGLQDLYVCASVKTNPNDRANLLYINEGADKSGIPKFREMATAYGLNDTTHSTQAAFFDYDNDGDLDVYILVNQILDQDYPNRFRPRKLDGSHPSTGRLYRNDWNHSLGHAFFTNVSKQAGVLIEGYGHGVSISDLNQDGWKDIYISNDYLSNNILYINNHDGTFTDKVAQYFKHTAANAMGNDINDINNDGLMDVIELDMNPEDNYRKKMMMNANSYQTYQNTDYFGYQYQYVRNTLQLNQGPVLNQLDSVGDPVFSDIGFMAGIAETDWSWTPMVVDFDNDGFRDIIITNGFPRDVTDHDFIAYRSQTMGIASKQTVLQQIPEVKIHNYAFHNNGNLTFSQVSADWGFQTPGFSNGAAYADLDNDGDLDVVVNNINDKAAVYENTATRQRKEHANYLQVQLEGKTPNRNGIGTWIELYQGTHRQVYEHNPVRGYLSSVQPNPHFGLDTISVLDSVRIKWPDGHLQVLRNVAANQLLIVKQSEANQLYNWYKPVVAPAPLFTDITSITGISYVQQENDFIDFNIQKLIPHKMSEYGPALAVGDLDGNGTDDLVCGGSVGYSPVLFLQNPDGKFTTRLLIPDADSDTKAGEDMGIALFDVEGDGDLDLYVARGSYEHAANGPEQADELFINDGKGNFSTAQQGAIPVNLVSKSCARAADFDRDGDLDLFIAGRVMPSAYPSPAPSFIYRNDSRNGQPLFTDVTPKVAPVLSSIGMVCDGVWTDFDNDGWPDLVLAGEWMPVTFLKNVKGILQNSTPQSGVEGQVGWFTSIVPGDFDKDGDMDYIAGNLGLNSFYRASDQYPVHLYAKDVDNNGSFDAVPTIFLPTSNEDTVRKEYPVHTREDMVRQIISTRAKYPNYKSYAQAPFSKMFTPAEMKDMLILKANNFQHALIRNVGNGKFRWEALPAIAQISCLNGMMVEDVNRDGNPDLLINGNDYGTEVSVGRYDGCNGLVLLGDGKGGFAPASILQSGLFIPGNGKALVRFRDPSGKKYLIAASQNRGALKIFRPNQPGVVLSVDPGVAGVMVKDSKGSSTRIEVNYGAGFLSQSGRFVVIPVNTAGIEDLPTTPASAAKK